MLNTFRCTFVGIRHSFCPSTIVRFVRPASSGPINSLPPFQERPPRLQGASPVFLIQQRHAPIKCWVDASIKNGLIAVVIGNRYRVFRTKAQDGVAGRNIHWAESVAFELLVHILLTQRFTGAATVYSDSQAALGAFNGLKSRDHLVTASSARLQAQRPHWPFRIRPEWVSSKHNLADPFTRGKPATAGYEELRHLIKLSETLETLVYQD